MKKLCKTFVFVLLALSFAGCVEDTHDLSKDIDATIAIGNGISFPLGDTEKIMLTEMIKGNDLLKTDEDGEFFIEQKGDVAALDIEVDIDLGSDMDFFYENTTEFEFNNPQLFIYLNNEESSAVYLKVYLSSYNRDGEVIAEDVELYLTLPANTYSKFYVTNNGAEMDGHSSAVADLKALFAEAPSKIKINLEPQGAAVYNAMGEYKFYIPFDFGKLKLEYTDKAEDVLGSNPDDAVDHIDNFEAVILSFDAYNTCPADFIPSLVAYDANGNVLKNIEVTTTDVIARGNGHLKEPVLSVVKMKLSSLEGELKLLNSIDIIMNGNGAGKFNENAYLQLKNIALTFDSPLILDFN